MGILKFFLFNRFAKIYLQKIPSVEKSILFGGKRIYSGMLGLIYPLIVLLPIKAIVSILITFLFKGNYTLKYLLLVPYDSIILMILVNKDIFGAQSIVHRVIGYQIVGNKNKMPANKTQCMLRNMTMPLFPIEAFVLIFSPSRRLGDLIAGTCLVEVPSTNPDSILFEMQNLKFDKELKLVLVFSTIWAVLLALLLAN